MKKCNVVQKHNQCVSKRQHFDCTEGANPCMNLNNLFLCEKGLCQNITSVFDCKYKNARIPDEKEKNGNCTAKRNCIELEGLYDCKEGMCSQVRSHSFIYNKQ